MSQDDVSQLCSCALLRASMPNLAEYYHAEESALTLRMWESVRVEMQAFYNIVLLTAKQL